GGTCLNIGCIPSKTLLHSSHLYEFSKKHFTNFGINIDGKVTLDLNKMMENKVAVVKKLTNGISSLFKKKYIFFNLGERKNYCK
ncbi:MAG: dihydrolipoyl dehydrogenase, partial [Pseudomonadota bacterium]|nr:dihydrolipoyl dehydrogenase [Pseudomonadota bacterium]